MRFLYIMKDMPFRFYIALGVLLAGAMLIAPLTYSRSAHEALDATSRRWAGVANPLLGFELTMPRQNIFSLARDMSQAVVVIDHAQVYWSHLLGFANFITRGSIYTVADALRWFGIQLTPGQARSVGLCQPLDRIHEDQPIVIRPDPWQRGIASWYGPGFDGRLAASGEIYHVQDITAAHKTLPLQSLVRVVALRTGDTAVVRINDRGPYASGRIIDLSEAAKQLLGMDDLASVYLERIDPNALDVQCQ